VVDVLSSKQRRHNMSQIRGRDTKPELMVRRLLHACGYRFRLHCRDLPGKPDLILPKWRTAIFVNGCFWHRHDCRYFKLPSTHREFWEQKISKNVERDKIVQAALLKDGWRVLVIWECALRGKQKHTPEQFISEVENFLVSGETPASELKGKFS